MDARDNRRDFFTGAPVEGELLADRLARGSVAPDEALRYAIALGNLLNKAHVAGLVHGSVSPWSIALTPSGAALLAPPSLPDPGAAAYRSPEQVRGEGVDWRSDVFSYGSVLYALVSEKPPFAGVGDELDHAIVERPPAALLSKSPIAAAIEGVVAACMQKDPALRRQRVKNAVIELRLTGLPRIAAAALRFRQAASLQAARLQKAAPVLTVPSGSHPGRWGRRLLIGGLVLLALAASSLAAVLILQRRPAPPSVLKFPVATPQDASYPGTPVISPDGRYLTFSAVGPEGKRMLWLRPLDEEHAQTVPGTEGASAPFWSPDSQVVAFFVEGALKTWKVSVDDSGDPAGAPQVLCVAGHQGGGGTWNREGVILFAPDLASGLYRVPATGGKPQPALALDGSSGLVSYRWPQYLPDGKHFLFYGLATSLEKTGVYVGSTDSSRTQWLFPCQTNAVYSPDANNRSVKSGYLLFIDKRDLMARPFNPSTLQTMGDPVRFATDIGGVESLALAPLSVSDSAVLVYETMNRPTRQLVWMDRTGKQLSKEAEPGNWGPPRISPDGGRVAVGKFNSDAKSPRTDLWIIDEDGSQRQITREDNGSSFSPVWSPDGSRIAFAANPDGVLNIYTLPATGQGKLELLNRSDEPKNPTDWSRDGKYILFGSLRPGTERPAPEGNVWALSLPDRRAATIVGTVFDENYATVSPDGRWMAYQSTESGKNQIYVQSFDGLFGGTKRKWQISVADGALPRWRSDGRELFYMTAGGGLMVVSLHPAADEFGFDPPRLLFQVTPLPNMYNLFDAAPDGERFLLNLPMEWTSSSPITVLTSWTEKLKH